ncbi:MAG: archaemetzincin family Zn-dependent metalloprotease [Bacteroidales bacterium]|jgi:archaemetzincin|nr:archaemetzincin family Zn-dependent metalloprotease [Bacteroidales bacterium]MDD3701945.1 archaemetzincin family Zn-dependent metalloprotease [Bacteroidales bacterium]MDY0369176.1 archaemetzincin family Zn-dependent metalloprotease [Bacteroidales bacterium]
MNLIRLISLGYFDRQLLENVAEDVSACFTLKTETIVHFHDLEPYYDSNRRQYDANRLLAYIEAEFRQEHQKTIGLVSVDLFIPILTYIFGQAYLNGYAAIASFYRLQNELYGLKQNNLLLKDRLVKEINHELGHCFGLIHCYDPVCVMRSSTYVEDIDQKSKYFCTKCQSHL